MLERESWGSGWQVSLRVTGVMRFLVVAFLGVWLCGWAAGEFFAGTTFLAGLRDWLAPDLDLSWLPHMKSRMPSAPAPVLAFLAVWLAGWTAGGLVAMREMVRALMGVDRVRWDAETLEVHQQAGPFSWRRRVRWSEINEWMVQRQAGVVAHTRKGLWRVTGFGTPEEQRELRDELVATWRQARGAELELVVSGELAPTGWVSETSDDGRQMLVSDPKPRRVVAILLAVVSMSLVVGAASTGLTAEGAAAFLKPAALTVLALLVGTGAAWLGLGRVELRPAQGSVRRVTRFLGREWSADLAPARLGLEMSRDSDGDERWALVASAPNRSLTLASDLYVPGNARHMGLWLARRMSVELEGLPEADAERRRAS